MSAPRQKVLARRRDGRIHAYVLEPGALGVLAPAAVFATRPGDEVVEAAVRPDLERAVYTTLNSVVCVGRDGEVVWTEDFTPYSEERYGHHPGCAYSLDGEVVWVYRPDAMAGRASGDQWVVHDAASGAVLGWHELTTVGHGGEHFVHPVDGSVYLDIGEGQDGTVVVRGTVGPGGEAEFVTYPWADRCVVGMAADGRHFMTVDHGQADAAFHRHPDGDVLVTVAVEDLGHDPDDTFVEWNSGYLTDELAVVTVCGAGEDDEDGEDGEEWYRHHLVEVRTGTVAGELTAEETGSDTVQPLGDGTWLTYDDGGNPVRRAYRR